jgi:hypothetical protein
MFVGLMRWVWHLMCKFAFLQSPYQWSYIIHSDEVEFRWTGNKLFLPGDANLQVGEVYNRYMAGDMAHYYSGSGSKSRRASGSQPLYSMSLELYVDKLKVPIIVVYTHSFFYLIFMQFIFPQNLSKATLSTSIRKRSAITTESENVPLQKRHANMAVGGKDST